MADEAAPSVEMDLGGLEAAFAQTNIPVYGSPEALGQKPAEAAPAPKTEEQPAPAADATPKPEEQPAATEDNSNKKPWERMKGEEPEKKEEPAATTEEAEMPKGITTKSAQDAFAKQRFEIKTLNEQRKTAETKLAELQKQFDEFKAKGAPSEADLKELEDLRTYRAAVDVKSTPEWQTTINEPVQQIFGSLKDIADTAKINYEALLKATDEPKSWGRALAIKKVFEGAEEAVPSELVMAAMSEAEKLHPIYAKANEMQAKAQEVWAGIKNQSEAQKVEAEKAAEAEYGKSHSHIYEQLKTKLPSLFADEKVAEAMKNARPSKDPADQAYQVLAGELLPTLTSQLQEARAEIKKLKASEAALLGTRATVSQINGNGAKKPDSGTELDEGGLHAAFAATVLPRH